MSADPLIQFLERRDQASFSALVARTRDDVLRAAFRVLRDRAAAEDVTQDVFLKCLNPPWSAGEIRSGRALLAATAVNLAKMRIRSDVRRRMREEISAESRCAETRVGLGGDDLERVRLAVDSLPEGLRRPVELRYFGGLHLAELARALDVSLTTAKTRLAEARVVLRTRLTDVRYGVTLAYVAAESSVSGVTDPQPTGALLAKLELLAAEGVEAARIAAEPLSTWNQRSGQRWMALAVIGALVLAIGGLGWMVSASSGDDALQAVATVRAADGNDGRAGVPGERRRVTIDPAAVTQPDAEPDGADAAALANLEAGSITLTVEVVDEAGNLVRTGHAHLNVAGLPDFDVMERLAPWKSLLDPQSLADANPIVVQGLPDFAHGIEIEAGATVPGFAPARLRTAKLAVGAGATIRVVVVPERNAALSVVDAESGGPVAGAEILFLTELDRREIDAATPPPAPAPGIGLTDASGRAVVSGLGEGPHEVEVRARGYAARVLENVAVRGGTVVKMVPQRAIGSIIVDVRAPDGSAAVGQRVNLSVTGRDTDRVGTIDATGRCRFDEIPVGLQAAALDIGDWVQHVLAGDAAPADTALTEMVDVVAGGEHLLRLGVLPAAAQMTVDVVRSDGAPLADMHVEIHGPLVKDLLSDEKGRVIFEGLPAGAYSVHVQNGDDATEWIAKRDVVIATGSPAHVRVVGGERRVSGRVVVADTEQSAHRVGVFVTDDTGRFLLLWTDRDGRFSFGGALSGGMTISFSAGGDLVTEIVRVDVAAATDPEPLAVRLRAGGSVLVVPKSGDMSTYRVVQGQDQAPQARVTDDGNHRVRGLPAGAFTLEVVRDGAVVGTHSVTIRVGAETILDLR